MSEDKSFSFFKGAVFGAIAGAVAGILMALSRGAETREDLKKLALEMGDKGKDIYMQTRKRVLLTVKELRDAGKKIDKDRYEEIVNEALVEIKNDFPVTTDVVKKIGIQLREDWEEIKGALKA
jgi:gas vesicle protein